MSGFGEMRGMSDFERDMWNGGYGPNGRWWMEPDEDEDEQPAPRGTDAPPPDPLAALNDKIERLLLYVQHDMSCRANDFDYLDKSPCTCGLRAIHNPKGQGQ